MHGLNGDILVWNPVTKRRHELSSMGIRVDASTLRRQLELTGSARLARPAVPPGMVRGDLPLRIGGGIGQSRTQMLLLKKAHLGEVSVSVWPRILKEMCHDKNIDVLRVGSLERQVMEANRRSWAEPYRIKMVEPIRMTSRQHRENGYSPRGLQHVSPALGRRVY